MKPQITGQLIFRDPSSKTNDGLKLMSFVGIIAVPKDFGFDGECQYTVAGNDGVLTIYQESRNDVSSESNGNSLGQLLTHAIWRY